MLHGLLHRLLHCFSLKIREGMGMRVFHRWWRENFRLAIERLTTTNVWFWKKCVAHLEFLHVCKVVVLSFVCVSCSPTNTSEGKLYKKRIIRRFPSVHNGQSRYSVHQPVVIYNSIQYSSFLNRPWRLLGYRACLGKVLWSRQFIFVPSL